MSLHPVGVAVSEVLAVEVHLQSFDGSFHPSALAVTNPLSAKVLRMLSVDLGLVFAIYPDVSALALLEATLSQRTARTHRLALDIIGRDPDVALVVHVASS